ncbi:MAG: alpha/beta hydrolase family protein [Betaproteobacteria bacterium]|nr:MAG: alpha/beta hydrolase family protein [Betaproteobacteria bacterium]
MALLNSYFPQKFFIDGPAGKLETVLVELNSERRRGIAVIAHPHPLYGGTMDNKVVHTLFKVLFELGFITVKFNFRGVGKSEGVYGEGVGETEDVITVVEALQNQFDARASNLPLLLAGFSFGGAVQAHVAQNLSPQTLVLVAPSVDRLNAPLISSYVDRPLIIHGDQDEVVSLKTVLDWATLQDLPVVVIPGAEHFFNGKLHILKRVVLDSCRS